jgi:ABC-type glycerol-3-phosphate transport system substrate-binding protein
MLTTNLVSYFEPGDQDKLLSGDLRFTDPKFVDALTALLDLKKNGCVPEDASTREQLDAANDLVTGKVAMMEGQPQFLPYFKDIRDKIGVTLIPMSGSSSYKANTASMAGDTWTSPRDSKNVGMAWEFIKLASDETAGTAMIEQLGSPPANLAAAAKITDPTVKFILDAIQNSKIGVLDTVMSQATALVWYRELQQAFSGQKSPTDTMKAIDDFNQSQLTP